MAEGGRAEVHRGADVEATHRDTVVTGFAKAKRLFPERCLQRSEDGAPSLLYRGGKSATSQGERSCVERLGGTGLPHASRPSPRWES
jgi:hypothetical protein